MDEAGPQFAMRELHSAGAAKRRSRWGRVPAGPARQGRLVPAGREVR